MNVGNDHNCTRKIIRADGGGTVLEQPTSLSEIKTLLAASSLDTVALRHLGAPLQVMLVDDNGYQKSLPINAAATALYLANCKPGTRHVIRGDVAVVFDGDYA